MLRRMEDCEMALDAGIDGGDVVIYEPIDRERIRGQIFEVRGLRVMLDRDIAEYFGVETKALNRAMKRNIKRFPEEFCFQLTREEYREILRCQSGTLELEQGKYSKYPPYIYTEEGVAMLTSALHTDRAIEASIQIIKAFVEMSHYLRDNRELLPYDELKELKVRHYELSDRVRSIEDNMVARSELSDLMSLFDSGVKADEVLILDGEPFKADMAYQRIYKKASKSIIVIDDYIGVKTLHHLAQVKKSVDVTVISDNKGYSPLRLSEYNDFLAEYPERKISFIKSAGRAHDRYIVLDFETKEMRLFHCGASSKDAGKKITTFTEIRESVVYVDVIRGLMGNQSLVMK